MRVRVRVRDREREKEKKARVSESERERKIESGRVTEREKSYNIIYKLQYNFKVSMK